MALVRHCHFIHCFSDGAVASASRCNSCELVFCSVPRRRMGPTLISRNSGITLLRAALDGNGRPSEPSRATRRLIRRAKEFLEANLARPIRLADVAQAVGASPAYLTDTFRRVEGIPLHGYLTQLRLARALVELRQADDLTRLALSPPRVFEPQSLHGHFSEGLRLCRPESRGSGRRRRSGANLQDLTGSGATFHERVVEAASTAPVGRLFRGEDVDREAPAAASMNPPNGIQATPGRTRSETRQTARTSPRSFHTDT